MQTKQILALAATLFTTTALAAPTADSILPEMVERQETSSPSPYFLTPIGARDVTPAALEERSSSIDKRGITIVLFGGDGCRGEQHAIVQDSGSFCYAVPAAKRSIHGVGNCRITSWNGTDCRGPSAYIPTSGCVNVLYGSVRVDC